jgi:hypothetical protein
MESFIAYHSFLLHWHEILHLCKLVRIAHFGVETRLDDQKIKVQFLEWAKTCSLLHSILTGT